MDRWIASLLLLAAITVAAACDPASGSAGGAGSSPAGSPGVAAGATPGATDRPSAPVATPGPGSATPSGGASGVPPSTGPAPSVAPSVAPSATPSSSPGGSGSTTGGLKPAPRPGPFAMDLYRTGDFVSEKRVTWCAPAAMQTMINVMTRGADTTRETQALLQRISRRLGPAPDGGPEPEGIARTLTSLGYGSWQVLAMPTRAAAVKAAVKAIRLTGRPADLLVWRGAHNWVVSGFTATNDPALGDDFTVTALRIEDVWYPRISTIWGPSRRPDVLVPVGLLPEDYLPWKRPTGRYPGKDGRFVLVIPVAKG